MRKLVLNLVKNAVEALDEESGCVRITTGVRRGESHTSVCLEVTDTGCGMDADTNKIRAAVAQRRLHDCLPGLTCRAGHSAAIKSSQTHADTERLNVPDAIDTGVAPPRYRRDSIREERLRLQGPPPMTP